MPGAPGLRWLKSPPSGDFPFSRASMSAIPSEADISRSCQHVSFVPNRRHRSGANAGFWEPNLLPPSGPMRTVALIDQARTS